MSVEAIEADFRRKVCSKVQLEREGGRFRVFTPFMLDDGDHLSVVLREENGGWVLSDEGHTYMHLTYGLDEADLHRGTRQRIISDALSSFGVDDRDGELTIPVEAGEYGDALYSFVQALLKITDVSFLTRERVAVPEERRAFGWHDPNRDPEAIYAVDCRIEAPPRPLIVLALATDAQTSVATITLHQFERWELAFRSLAIFEDQQSIGRPVLARLSDVCDKQFAHRMPN